MNRNTFTKRSLLKFKIQTQSPNCDTTHHHHHHHHEQEMVISKALLVNNIFTRNGFNHHSFTVFSQLKQRRWKCLGKVWSLHPCYLAEGVNSLCFPIFQLPTQATLLCCVWIIDQEIYQWHVTEPLYAHHYLLIFTFTFLFPSINFSRN